MNSINEKTKIWYLAQLNYFYFFKFLKNFLKFILFDFKMGIGDWGLGIGDWGLGQSPNPQSP